MSNAYKIIHYFISGASSREIKEKVWKWLIDSHGQPEKEAALKQKKAEDSFYQKLSDGFDVKTSVG